MGTTPPFSDPIRGARLLDERSTPALRTVLGSLMAGAHTVDFAIARIRLANLDLNQQEMSGPHRCRVLLGQLDASTLIDADAASRSALDGLIRWAGGGRLAVRSAGIGAWTPDFSVYRGPDGTECMVGAHYFGSPQLTVGPSFTVVTADPATAQMLGRRFTELWQRSHDVLPAILGVLERVRRGLDPAG